MTADIWWVQPQFYAVPWILLGVFGVVGLTISLVSAELVDTKPKPFPAVGILVGILVIAVPMIVVVSRSSTVDAVQAESSSQASTANLSTAIETKYDATLTNPEYVKGVLAQRTSRPEQLTNILVTTPAGTEECTISTPEKATNIVAVCGGKELPIRPTRAEA